MTAPVVIAGLVCLLGSPGRASAQGTTWEGATLQGMVDSARIRLGALRMNASFLLSNAGYDTDVYYGYLAEPFPDWTFSAGLPVQVLLPLSKKVVVDLSGSPRYAFFLNEAKERAWNNTFRGLIHVALDKMYLQAGGGIANNRQRFSPELDIYVRVKTDGLNGRMLFQTSKNTALALGYEGAEYRYEDVEYLGTSIADRLDRHEDHLDLTAYVQPSARMRFFLDGQYGTYKFKGPAAVIRNADSYSVYAGVEFTPRIGELVQGMGFQGSVKLGYMYFDIADPGWVNGSGFAGEAEVSFKPMKRTTGRIVFARGFQFSIYAGASYYLSTAIGGGITRHLSRKVSLSYDLTYGTSAYPSDSGFVGGRNRFMSHAFGLDIRLSRQLGAALIGTLSRRVPSPGAPALTHGFFGLSMTYLFGKAV